MTTRTCLSYLRLFLQTVLLERVESRNLIGNTNNNRKRVTPASGSLEEMRYELLSDSTDDRDGRGRNHPLTWPCPVGAPPIGATFSHTILSTKYWDADTKLLAYQLRDYSPGMGRWVSRDPFEEYAHLYLVLGNEAIGKIDILGLATMDQDHCHPIA
jgi:RHS repeat-associated protein